MTVSVLNRFLEEISQTERSEVHKRMVGPIHGGIHIADDCPRLIEPFLIRQIDANPFGPEGRVPAARNQPQKSTASFTQKTRSKGQGMGGQ